MKGILKGKKVVKFVGKDGNEVEGITYHVQYKENGVNGVVCDNFFVNANKGAPDLPLESAVSFYYNRYGKVDVIIPDEDGDVELN